jgi:hypothetical protein
MDKLVSLILIVFGFFLIIVGVFMAFSSNLIPPTPGVYDPRIFFSIIPGVFGAVLLAGGIILFLKNKNH